MFEIKSHMPNSRNCSELLALLKKICYNIKKSLFLWADKSVPQFSLPFTITRNEAYVDELANRSKQIHLKKQKTRDRAKSLALLKKICYNIYIK
jgi:hypothetical protein